MWKKRLRGAVLFLVIFLGTALLVNFFENRNISSRAVEASNPAMEEIYMYAGGMAVNPMQACTAELDTSLFRDTISAVGEDKNVSVLIPDDLTDRAVFSYQIRNFDGSNLIEEGDLRFLENTEGMARFGTTIRMDLQEGTEYSFVVHMKPDGASDTDDLAESYFYTRIVPLSADRSADFISYAEEFSDGLFRAGEEDTGTATDADAEAAGFFRQEDDTVSLADTDDPPGRITASSTYREAVSQGMHFEKTGNTLVKIRELSADSACVELDYKTLLDGENSIRTFSVAEYFTLSMDESAGGVRISDYRRDTDEDFSIDKVDPQNGKIGPLITSGDISEMASADGKQLAFTENGTLWFYNAADGTVTDVYGPSGENESRYERQIQNGYVIRILNVDDQEVDFAVYGRISGGQREGSCGIQLYAYDVTESVLQEQLFLDTNLEREALKTEAGRLLYYQRKSRTFYTMIGQEVIAVNTRTGKTSRVISGISPDHIFISDDMQVVAWPDTDAEEKVQKISVLNLVTGKKRTLTRKGKILSLLGFAGQDILYGEADPDHVTAGADGKADFLFDSLHIIDRDGEEVKDYHKDGVYVSGVSLQEDMISLDRVQDSTATDALAAAPADHISYEEAEGADTVTVETAVSEDGSREKWLDFPDSVYLPGETQEILTRVSPEKGRTVSEKGSVRKNVYYIFGASGLRDISPQAGEAVLRVEQNGGEVADAAGRIIYRDHPVRKYNTIAGTFDYMQGTGKDGTFDACIWMALRAAGTDADFADIRKLHDWARAFEQEGDGILGLNLTGISLDTAVSFLSDGNPFAARIGDRYVLVVSYNPDFIRYYDPETGEEKRVSRSSFEQETKNAGNEFYSYR